MWLRCISLIVLLGWGTAVHAQQVLVSIHPLALLVKSAWPELNVTSLMAANQSPHDFALRPSDRKKIHRARSVVWLGPDFEPYLSKVLRKQKQVDLSEFAPSEHHGAHGNHGDKHDHEEQAHDPHLWLNPKAILPILKKIEKDLSLPEPTLFMKRFQLWEIKAQRQFFPHVDAGFVSFHDAFHYWVDAFRLNQLAMVTSHPEQPLGTRHVSEIRKLLESGQAQCLFVEPQFNAPIVNKLHKGLDLKIVNIDPMASTYKIKDANFLEFYEGLVGQFKYCFAAN